MQFTAQITDQCGVSSEDHQRMSGGKDFRKCIEREQKEYRSASAREIRDTGKHLYMAERSVQDMRKGKLPREADQAPGFFRNRLR